MELHFKNLERGGGRKEEALRMKVLQLEKEKDEMAG